MDLISPQSAGTICTVLRARTSRLVFPESCHSYFLQHATESSLTTTKAS